MSKETDALTKMLAKYVGNSAGLLLLREMDKLQMGPDLTNYSERLKLQLISGISMNILGTIVSPQRLSMLKSKMMGILELDSKFEQYMSVESLSWGIVLR